MHHTRALGLVVWGSASCRLSDGGNPLTLSFPLPFSAVYYLYTVSILNSGDTVLQVERWRQFDECLSQLWPDKDMSAVKKYHNGAHHVHTIGWALGGWELASTNMFEIFNKLEKKLVLHRSNRKNFQKQVLAREVRALTTRAWCWMERDSVMRPPIRSTADKKELRRGFGIPEREASGLQFPIHELVVRMHPTLLPSLRTRSIHAAV